MKEYLLILLTVLGIGLVATPNITVAEDVEETFSTELQVLPEITSISELESIAISETAEITAPVATPVVSSTKNIKNPTPLSFDYQVTKSTSSIVESPSNYDIYKTDKLVYAHNDENLMLSALSLNDDDGSTFTVDGVSYRVNFADIYSKAELNEIVPGTSHNLMSEVVHGAKDRNGVKHKIALMTCYERTRSAAHRYIVFGD